jgi:hypothetical protein
LQAIGTDGRPYVAQVSEHGDPAALTLDLVDELPAEAPVALTVEYDGNLNMPNLSPGPNSALLQLLREPADGAQSAALWRYSSSAVDGGLHVLETKPTGMTDTFLQVDAQEPAPIVVANAPGGQAGVLQTVTAVRGEMVPARAPIELRDDPAWPPSGRVDGGEYDDLLAAADLLDATELSGFVAASETLDVGGIPYAVDMMALLQGNELLGTACSVRGADSSRVSASRMESPTATIGEQHVLAALCLLPTDPRARVVITASQPGTDPVVLEADGEVVAGPAPSLIIDTPAVPSDATLVVRVDGSTDATDRYQLAKPAT